MMYYTDGAMIVVGVTSLPATAPFPFMGIRLPNMHPVYGMETLPLPPDIERVAGYNRITWPVWGLTRYAEGHLLFTGDDLAALVAANAGSTSAAGHPLIRFPLTLDDGNGAPLTLTVHVVAQTPITEPRVAPAGLVAPASDSQLWCVTVSDPRYRWHENLFGDGRVPHSTATWGDLLSSLIAGASGQTVSASSINSLLPAYTTPPFSAWSAPSLAGKRYSILADAVAANLNLRILVAFNGTVSVQNATTAAAAQSIAAVTADRNLGGRSTWETTQQPGLVAIEYYDATGVVGTSRHYTDFATGVTTGNTATEATAESSISVALTHTVAANRKLWVVDFVAWRKQPGQHARLDGFLPLPASSCTDTWVVDHDAGYSYYLREPGQYPWPTSYSGVSVVFPYPLGMPCPFVNPSTGAILGLRQAWVVNAAKDTECREELICCNGGSGGGGGGDGSGAYIFVDISNAGVTRSVTLSGPINGPITKSVVGGVGQTWNVGPGSAPIVITITPLGGDSWTWVYDGAYIGSGTTTSGAGLSSGVAGSTTNMVFTKG